MARKQQALAEAIPDDGTSTSLSSFIGVDGTNMTLNSGRMLITLKPLRRPQGNRCRGHSPALQRTRDVSGISVAMQPVQDLTVDSTVGKAQYLFFLENPDASAFATWIPKLVERLRQNPVSRTCRATSNAGPAVAC